MAKDPTAYLRRESRAMHTPSLEVRDNHTLGNAISYMKQRGYFSAFADENGIFERGMKFVPVIEGLPWNPEAPKRIVEFRVTIERSGYRDTMTYRGNKRRGGPSWGNWTEEVGRVRVPNWDYDGCTSEAREAWELETTNRMLDYAARDRLSDQDHSWSIEHEVSNLEIGCREEWCPDQQDERNIFVSAYGHLFDAWPEYGVETERALAA